ncbi:MAG: hypothetical protein Kow0080_00070 [Candidatus Promineifilaceae bacterium]
MAYSCTRQIAYTSTYTANQYHTVTAMYAINSSRLRQMAYAIMRYSTLGFHFNSMYKVNIE